MATGLRQPKEHKSLLLIHLQKSVSCPGESRLRNRFTEWMLLFS